MAVLVAGNTLGRYQGWFAKRQSPAELSSLLRPSYRTFLPDGQGPWPTALLFSGCDGPKDNMERWAAALNAKGWAALVVDSHHPRDFDEAQAWRLICAGQLLTGAERAGDVAVAIDDARSMPFVDPDQIVLLGSSHGGWSILDLLSLHGRDRLPQNLTQWPVTFQDRGLDGVVGAILLYPYCGPGSQVWRFGWSDDIPALFLLVDDDTIADEDSCISVANRAIDEGKDVEVQLLAGTTHGFDQQEKNALSTLEFSPEALEKSFVFSGQFLDRTGVSATDAD